MVVYIFANPPRLTVAVVAQEGNGSSAEEASEYTFSLNLETYGIAPCSISTDCHTDCQTKLNDQLPIESTGLASKNTYHSEREPIELYTWKCLLHRLLSLALELLTHVSYSTKHYSFIGVDQLDIKNIQAQRDIREKALTSDEMSTNPERSWTSLSCPPEPGESLLPL